MIPAKVVADDALAWHQTKLLDKGTLRGVRRDAMVTSNLFVNVGEQRVASGMMVLAGEVLVGRIARTGTHTSRLVLLTDPGETLPVRIGKVQNGELNIGDADFMMFGLGGDRLEIREVPSRYIEQKLIEQDAVVVSSPVNTQLPVSMVVGTVKHIRRNDRNRLLYTIEVEPAVTSKQLRRVYVIDPVGK